MMENRKGVRAAHLSEVLVRQMNAIAGRWSAPIPEPHLEMISHDIRIATLFNDLRYLSLHAYTRNAIVKAAWFGVVNERRFEICEPADLPSDFVLGQCHFNLVLYRTGKLAQYEHLVRLEWPSVHLEPEGRRLGRVVTLPRGGRRGWISYGRHRARLLPRDAVGLRERQQVEFTLARRRSSGEFVAFLVNPVGEEDR